MKRYESVESYIDGLENWQEESIKLRKILVSTGATETLKWSMPVYVANGKNVFGIFSSKKYFGIWFYQGALLADHDQVLINAQQGKTQAMRQWRFTSIKEIKVRQIKSYLIEAIGLAEAGKEIRPNRNKPVNIPALLTNALMERPQAKQAFEKLSKSCRREYADYIAEAKREETKIRRIEKIIPMIIDSKGLNDKYR